MIIQVNILTVAIVVCVIGVIALGAYIAGEILRDRDEQYDPRWMDRERWEETRL